MCDISQENFYCEEVKTAISLPATVQGQEYSSTFQKLLDEKEQQYRELQKKMKYDIMLVTENIDDNIDQYRATASEELSMLKEGIYEEELGITTLEDLVRFTELKETRRLEIEKILHELSLDLDSLELSRTEDVKMLMSNFREGASKLKHFSDDQIEKYLEAEIVNVNTQMFKNMQKIEDIKLQLQVQADDIINMYHRILVDRTKVITEQHTNNLRKEMKKKQGDDLLLEATTCLSDKCEEAREIFTQITADLFQKLAEFPSCLELPEEYDINGDFWRHWMRSLNNNLGVLDKLCKNVNDLLNKSANALVEKFEEQISSITLKVHQQVEEFSDDSDSQEKEFAAKFDALRNSTSETLKELQTSWQNTVDKITSEIERAKDIVSDFTFLWTNHLARFDKIRRSIKESEENTFTTLTKNEQAKIKLLKNKTKAAREAKDVKKLEDLCNKLEETYYLEVENWDDSFLAQKEWVEHVKRIEFENLIMDIKADIRHLLNVKYPKLDRFSEALSLRISSSVGSEEKGVPVKQVEEQENSQTYLKAVENRCLGVYEMMERYLPECAVILREEAEDWMFTHIMQVLVPVYDTRVRELKETAKKEVNCVRKVRFAEIQIHADRASSHSAAVKEELSSLSEQMKRVEENQQLVLKEFSDRIGAVETGSEKPLVTKIFVLQNQWQSIAESLEENILTAKAQFEAKIEALNGSNSLFLATAKSFKSGGNYSPEELKELKKLLTSLSKSVATQKKMLANKYNELLNNVKSPVLESKMQLIQEELKGTNLKQDICDDLSILRMHLRTEIEVMKSKNQDLENNIKSLSKVKKIDDTYTKQVIAKIESIICYLKFPENMKSLECTEDKQDSVLSVNIGLSKHKAINNKKMNPVEPSTLKPLLKNTNKIDEHSHNNNFFSNTKGLILKKYENLFNIIQKAHSSNQTENNKPQGNKKTVADGAEKYNHAQQITNLKSILRTYNSECESVWYFECKRFFQLVKQLRVSCNEFTSNIFNCVHEQYIHKLNSLENAFKLEREGFFSAEESKRDKKHFPLVLAHPNHGEKLNKWKETVTNSCTTAVSTFRDMLKQHTTNLQDMHDSYVSRVKLLKDHFNLVQTLVFDSNIYKPLQENISGISFFKPYKLSEEYRNEDDLWAPSSIWSDTECIRKEEMFVSSDTSDSLISEFDIDIPKTSIDCKAIESIKESGLTARQFFIEEATFFKRFETETNEWLESLETEIKQCQNLYNIEDIDKSLLEKYGNKK